MPQGRQNNNCRQLYALHADSNAGGTSPARPFGGWEVGIPVGLAVGASPSGLPDLRIELVRVRWGSSTSKWAGGCCARVMAHHCMGRCL